VLTAACSARHFGLPRRRRLAAPLPPSSAAYLLLPLPPCRQIAQLGGVLALLGVHPDLEEAASAPDTWKGLDAQLSSAWGAIIACCHLAEGACLPPADVFRFAQVKKTPLVGPGS